MSTGSKILVPLLLIAFSLSPMVPMSDAATVSSLSLRATGSGSNAYFDVEGLVNWNLFTDSPSDFWQLEYEFHGMDGSHSDIIARWTYPVSRGASPRTIVRRRFWNDGRWANEDPDRWFSKRRDEIRVIVYLRKNSDRVGPGELSLQVTGNF